MLEYALGALEGSDQQYQDVAVSPISGPRNSLYIYVGCLGTKDQIEAG